MSTEMRRRGLLTSAIIGASLLFSLTPRLLLESSPVARGGASANARACIECHGRTEIGYPDDAALKCAKPTINITHPRYEGRCVDLLAFFEVVRLKRSFKSRASSAINNRLLQGERLARKYNCFQCHGELGQGGFRNAGALKGYIPGYFGNDFALLTQGGSPSSVSAWIRQGVDPALIRTPIKGAIAQYFINRQEISMPIFGTLSDADIQILSDYVTALHKLGKLDAKRIREYGYRTQAL